MIKAIVLKIHKNEKLDLRKALEEYETFWVHECVRLAIEHNASTSPLYREMIMEDMREIADKVNYVGRLLEHDTMQSKNH